MTLSMNILCLLLLAIHSNGESSSPEQTAEYTIPIKKTLDQGVTVFPQIDVELRANETTLQVWYSQMLPFDDYTEIISVSVYFANDEKAITAVAFEDGTMIASFYNKPWQYAGSKADVNVVTPDATTPATIPLDWLPKDITRVSASAIVTNGPNSPRSIINYYGIKNFAISLEDTFVIENYMLADLTLLSTTTE